MIFSISAIRVLWSFVAQLKKIQNDNTDCYISHNLIFYGDIYKFDAEQYLNRLYEKYTDDKVVPQPLPAYEIDLANQIIINSYLAMRKGTLFNNTVYFIIISISFFIFFILIFNIFF